MTDCSLESSVPDWIIDHPETLQVFEKWGIDFSCGGKSLLYACQQQGLDEDEVLRELHRSIEGERPQCRSSLPNTSQQEE